MNQILGDLVDIYALVYLDDILIFSCTEEEHWKHIYIVFNMLAKFEYYVKCKKCKLFPLRLNFLATLSQLLLLVLFRPSLMLSSSRHIQNT